MTKKLSNPQIYAIIILVFLVSGCSGDITGQAIKQDTIKVGVIATLSSYGAYLGQQEVRGVRLAVEQINANGGINGKQIELIVEDSKSDVKTAVSVMHKLINYDDVKYIIGDSWASTTVPLVDIANQNQIILISPVALLSQLTADDYFYRTIPSVKDMMEILSNYIYNELNARTASLLVSQNPYATEHAEFFTQLFEAGGGTVLSSHEFPVETVDLSTELTHIKEDNPDVIMNLHASGIRVGDVMRQAIELGIDAQWIGPFGSENADTVEQFKVASEGLIYPYPYDINSDSTKMQEFQQTFIDRFDILPDNTAAGAYDAMIVLSQAIGVVGEQPQNIKSYFDNVEDFQGASGTFSFDQNGDVQKNILIKQIQDGEFVTLDFEG